MKTIIASFLIASSLVLVPAAADAAEHQVAVRDFVFDPAELTIEVGDTVTWTNEGGTHNVNAPGFFRCANGCDGEGGNGDPASNLWSFSRTFDSQAEIDYVCDVHEAIGMVGSLSVVEAGGLTLTVEGACPGDAMITVAGGTPNGRLVMMFSDAAGNEQLPGGPCAGMETGLEMINILTFFDLDGSGGATLTPTLPSGACGLLLQALDVTTCDLSNTSTIPGGGTEKSRFRNRRRPPRR